MTILLSSNVLTEIVNNTGINIQRKLVKGTSNYYFTPNMGVKLYNAQVSEVNPKYIVFKYKLIEATTLHTLLSFINSTFKASVNHLVKKGKPFYNLFNSSDDYFYIRCHLPYKYGRYFTSYTVDGVDTPFKLPRPGLVYSQVVFEIRNVWETTEKAGFNLEVKQIVL
jgi:hypothetical protein